MQTVHLRKDVEDLLEEVLWPCMRERHCWNEPDRHRLNTTGETNATSGSRLQGTMMASAATIAVGSIPKPKIKAQVVSTDGDQCRAPNSQQPTAGDNQRNKCNVYQSLEW
jgi:hypothetical protein